jgi:hypothetical protein
VIIASWLLEIEAGRSGSVRDVLRRQPGIECRGERGASIVVLTHLPAAEGGLSRLREVLCRIPGVRGADLVTAFDEDEAPALSQPA